MSDGSMEQTLLEQQNTMLKQQLLCLSKLLSHSLRAESGCNISSTVQQLETVLQQTGEMDGKFQSQQSELNSRITNLQNLTEKQDQFILKLQSQLKKQKADADAELVLHQSQIKELQDKSNQTLNKLQSDLTVNREQSKKLVQLIQKMELKLQESENRCESLDAHNISLKEACYSLKTQLDRLENQFESKLAHKQLLIEQLSEKQQVKKRANELTSALDNELDDILQIEKSLGLKNK